MSRKVCSNNFVLTHEFTEFCFQWIRLVGVNQTYLGKDYVEGYADELKAS